MIKFSILKSLILYGSQITVQFSFLLKQTNIQYIFEEEIDMSKFQELEQCSIGLQRAKTIFPDVRIK